jgi:hypothetical protein
MRLHPSRLAAIGLAVIIMAGCFGGPAASTPTQPAATASAPPSSVPASPASSEAPSAAPSVEPVPSDDLGTFSCDLPIVDDATVARAQIVDVRVGSHDDYDRVVFEFEEPDPNPAGNGGIPHYQIRTARAPFTEDPSDLPIDVEGDAFARIIFQGASGYDFDGNATYDGPRRITPGFGSLTQAVEGGDFEATMTWILGLSRPTCWQIHALHDPDRLIIDFHHV